MKYNEDSCSVELSVSSLCERACRRGDLDSPTGKRPMNYSLQADVYKKLQREGGASYRPRVELSCTVQYRNIYFAVSGEADGIFREGDGVTVDEIVGVRGYEFFAPPAARHMARLKCLSYFYALREDREWVGGRITYYNIDSGKVKYFRYRFERDDLYLFYVSLLEKIYWEAEFEIKKVTEELPTLASASFPFSGLRDGQESMVRECYRAIKKGKRLFVSAPTGIGKTMSALYPAVRVVGERHADKIFYLTAKASTGREAYRAASRLCSSGVKLRAVVISAKEQMCRRGRSCGIFGNSCTGESCPYASGYYDRIDRAVSELLSEHRGYPQNLILEKAQKYTVCPYELSLELSEYCDIIICDYNYAFDPSVYMRRYFASDKPLGNYIFLIDEAHNLADRARGMYSAVIHLGDFTELSFDSTEQAPELVKIIDSAAAEVMSLKKLCRDELIHTPDGDRGFYMSGKPLDKFNMSMDIFRKKAEAWMKKNREHPLYFKLDLLVSLVRKYLCINEMFDEGFLCYVEIFGGNISAKIFCLDPSSILNSLMGRARSAVLFSATLAPMSYFMSVLGGAKGALSLELPSPFSPDNVGVAVLDSLSVRYEDRAKNAPRFASAIAAAVSQRHGNYIAYFPSYECLENVLEVFCKKYPKVDVVVQKRNMSYRDREEFLSAFKDREGRLTIGFCVLGGAFSEGVDLPGSRLIGTIIFGVGLPGLSNERNIMRDHFDARDGEGYDYAYTYPGMNNVLQAAGRVIRREDDRGVIVLVDDRYSEPKYKALFPSLWHNIKYAGNAASLAEIMRRFWENPADK